MQLISPVCKGDVRLILADGAKLTANGLDDKAGIQISGDDNSLTIYGQAAQSGQLIATSETLHAGIGGGAYGNGSNITINGGTVTATGTFGAGIGGGAYGNGSNITINGGIVTATSSNGASIGGGLRGNGSNITINGGTVTAHTVLYGAGIGGGYLGSGSDITINGGTVTANGGSGAAGIGSGKNGPAASDIFVATILTLKAGSTENPADAIANNGEDLAESLAGKRYVTITEVFNITANQDPNNKANYYSTFYSGTKAYSVPSGVTAYTGAVDGSMLRLTAIEDGIIPAGEAVILRLTSEEGITATKQQFDLTAKTTKATKSKDNELKGTDAEMTLGEKDYALSLGQNGVGFYLWNGKSIDAHKAYLTLSSGAKAFTFEFNDEPSGIKEIFEPYDGTTETYNLNGMRVGKDYKGIVVVRGKKYMKK